MSSTAAAFDRSKAEWEEKFRSWMGSASDTEKARREHAVSMIYDAIRASRALQAHETTVFAQGSFRNNTNIPEESDVDVCVLCSDTIHLDTSGVPSFTHAGAGLTSPASYPYSAFKNDVGNALVAKFGASAVKPGNKAFDIRDTSYRVEADVVAAIEHRHYTSQTRYIQPAGTFFWADDGKGVTNWPEQHYSNGVNKNQNTGRRFKGVTRVLKELRFEMVDAGIAAARPIPSYLVECLVFNAPNPVFGHSFVYDDVREVIASVYLATRTDEPCKEWGEVNEIKYLFRPGQSWTREQANAFLLAAWRFVGFTS
jgi:hypothetical protein